MEITFNRELLAACSHMTGVKDIRYYLNGVYFNTKAQSLEATSGAVAIRTMPDSVSGVGCDSFIMPNQFVTAVLRAYKKEKQLTVSYDPQTKLILCSDVAAHAIDGHFPPMHRVFPDIKPSGEYAEYHYDALTKCHKAKHALGETTMAIQPNGQYAGVIVCNQAHILIMPLRDSSLKTMKYIPYAK